MVVVRPFRGLRYKWPAVGTSLTDVICPPYDVISDAEQAELEARSPYNAIRLELPDGDDDQRYTNAANLVEQWSTQGVLARDETPYYYVTRRTFSHEGRTFSRMGLSAAVRLEDYERRVVMPHEYTRAQAKEDRYRLMEACATNFSPVMALYRDPGGRIRDAIYRVTRDAPSATALYGEDEEIALWTVEASKLDDAIRQTLHEAQVFIADGHHRYETALRYRDAMRGRRGWSDEEAFNYALVTLIDFDDSGLLVLPYHRALRNMSPPTLSAVRDRLLEVFHLRTIDPQPRSARDLERAVNAQPGVSVGLLGPDGEGPYMLTLREGPVREKLSRLPNGDALLSSDGWVLHQGILEPVLGDPAPEEAEYLHDPREAWRRVLSGDLQMAFYLKPFPMDLFRAVVSTGQRLPPKSTYFHPKLPTGLVFNPLWGQL